MSSCEALRTELEARILTIKVSALTASSVARTVDALILGGRGMGRVPDGVAGGGSEDEEREVAGFVMLGP